MQETAITVFAVLFVAATFSYRFAVQALNSATEEQKKASEIQKKVIEELHNIRQKLGERSLEESVAAGVAIARKRRFMASKIGICDLKNPASVSSNRSGATQNDALRTDFGSKCVVTGDEQPTGSQATPNGTPMFTLGHIVQRKIFGNTEFMNDFDISVEDVDADSNFLFLRADVHKRLNKCEFCFWPHERGNGTFRVFPLTEIDPDFYQELPESISIPAFVSRKMLFVQAMDAFRRAGRSMPSESAWESCNARGQGIMIAEWLAAVVTTEQIPSGTQYEGYFAQASR